MFAKCFQAISLKIPNLYQSIESTWYQKGSTWVKLDTCCAAAVSQKWMDTFGVQVQSRKNCGSFCVMLLQSCWDQSRVESHFWWRSSFALSPTWTTVGNAVNSPYLDFVIISASRERVNCCVGINSWRKYFWKYKIKPKLFLMTYDPIWLLCRNPPTCSPYRERCQSEDQVQ